MTNERNKGILKLTKKYAEAIVVRLFETSLKEMIKRQRLSKGELKRLAKV